MKKKIVMIAKIIVLIMFIIIMCFPKAMQNDVFWSIKTGQDLLESGIKQVDDWSIHTGLRTIAHHYLTDIVIYFIYSFSSFNGLFVFNIVWSIGVVVLLYVLNITISNNKKISYMFLYAEILLLKPFIAIRAFWVSIVVFLIELIALEKFMKKQHKKYLFILTILPLVLMWTHMGVIPLYFVILGVYIIGSLIELKGQIKSEKSKKIFFSLLIVSLIGLGVSFINPYGLDGLTYSVKTIFADTTGSISEFQPLTISTSYIGIIVFIYTLLIIGVIFINKEIRLIDLLLILGTFFMTLVSIRYLLYYAICSATILRYLSKIKLKINATDMFALKGAIWTIIVYFMFIMFQNVVNAGNYIDETEYPVNAYNNIKEYITENTRMFNEWEWGSYLALNGEKVFIDSRGDLYTDMYTPGVTIFKDYLNINKDYVNIIKKYNINMFIIRTDSVLTTIVSLDNEFEEIYSDDVASVYIKK